MLLSYIDNSNVFNYFHLGVTLLRLCSQRYSFGTLDIDRGCVDFPPCVPKGWVGDGYQNAFYYNFLHLCGVQGLGLTHWLATSLQVICKEFFHQKCILLYMFYPFSRWFWLEYNIHLALCLRVP